MELIEELKATLADIDAVIDKYDSCGGDPDRTLGQVFEARAAQRPFLEEGLRQASAGLERFPLNRELLRRRAG